MDLLEGIKVENKREFYDRISESHHPYHCTASMEKDRELGDTILHRAGYIIRAAVEAEGGKGKEGKMIHQKRKALQKVLPAYTTAHGSGQG